MRSRFTVHLPVLSACLVLMCLVLGCPPKEPEYSMRYSIIGLDTRSGYASDINASCEVVGRLDFGHESGAFLWLPNEAVKMRSLLGNGFSAYGINDYGEITGSMRIEYFRHACRWTEGEGLRDIGPLYDNFGVGWDISNTGTIVGEAGGSDDMYRAFSWTADAGMQNLAQAQPGSHAYGVNNFDVSAGVRITGGSPPNTVYEVRSWTADGIERGLQNVLGNGGALANAINDLNLVVGMFQDTEGVWTACSWTASGGMRNLGGLGGQRYSNRYYFTSEALDINWHGQIVGTSYIETGIRHAVLWEDGVCYDLNYLAPIASSPEWGVINSADAINNKGCIVGSALRKITDDILEDVPYILVPVIPEDLILSPSVANDGQTIQCTVTFSGKLPIEMRIKLDLADVSGMVGPAVGVVDVPKGEDRGHFVLHAKPLLRTRTGDVAVKVGGYRLTAPLTVKGIEIPIG